MVEQQLRELYVRGTGSDLREFIILAGPLIYSFLSRIGVTTSERDDLYQEVMIIVIQSRQKYDESRPILPWLYTITVNLTRSKFRMKKNTEAIDSVPDQISELPDSLAEVIGKELYEKLKLALRRLPLQQREAIILCGFEQVDQKEAAQILSIPEATLRTNLRRARLSLAKVLKITELASMRL